MWWWQEWSSWWQWEQFSWQWEWFSGLQISITADCRLGIWCNSCSTLCFACITSSIVTESSIRRRITECLLLNALTHLQMRTCFSCYDIIHRNSSWELFGNSFHCFFSNQLQSVFIHWQLHQTTHSILHPLLALMNSTQPHNLSLILQLPQLLLQQGPAMADRWTTIHLLDESLRVLIDLQGQPQQTMHPHGDARHLLWEHCYLFYLQLPSSDDRATPSYPPRQGEHLHSVRWGVDWRSGEQDYDCGNELRWLFQLSEGKRKFHKRDVKVSLFEVIRICEQKQHLLFRWEYRKLKDLTSTCSMKKRKYSL